MLRGTTACGNMVKFESGNTGIDFGKFSKLFKIKFSS